MRTAIRQAVKPTRDDLRQELGRAAGLVAACEWMHSAGIERLDRESHASALNRAVFQRFRACTHYARDVVNHGTDGEGRP